MIRPGEDGGRARGFEETPTTLILRGWCDVQIRLRIMRNQVRFCKALGEIYGNQIDCVVLFGSRARGDARPDSDYDVAVFLKSLPDRAARRRSWIVWLSSAST